MNTRTLSGVESANLGVLTQNGIDCALLFITATGLKKSILDAVLPVRTLLASNGVHDYAEQQQGPEHKVVLDALLLADEGSSESRTSLYRPITKKGDPRIWFSGLPRFACANDVLAVFVTSERIHALNLSRCALAEHWQRISSPLSRLVASIAQTETATANELLRRLREIAAEGPLEAVWTGSGAIGRSIERRLGLPENADRAPDYKGIELKSGRVPRRGQDNRYTLFGCVPNWQLSAFKSSAQILDSFGYDRQGIRQLYCTVSTRGPNSQGLQFRVDDDLRRLVEFARQQARLDVAVWELSRLHTCLAEKHRETFWIRADSVKIKTKEHFLLKSVTHTRRPSLTQFDRMIIDGSITMDHLIRRKAGRVKEHGPLFKIWPKHLPDLFLGQPITHDLCG